MQKRNIEPDLPPFVRLDFEERSLLYSSPSEVIATRDPARLRACLDQLRGRQAAGFISYEAGHALEPKLASRTRGARPDDPPLLWFGIFQDIQPAPPLPYGESAWAGEPVPGISFEQYSVAVDEIQTRILDGDVYQVNFTFPCSVPIAGNPIALYAQLRERAGASWSALVFTGTHWLISCSPELFFDLKAGRIRCRPMKGTAPPDSDPEALRRDPKNRAENLMIVDLMRNDLSRISVPGSVKVPELFAIEHYPTVLQMTSTVEAKLNTGMEVVDVLQTIFPCGSITGAPKIRAMELIDQLEQSEVSPRGPYTGSIGHVHANGDAEFNVAIRTLVLAANETKARYNVGSAIVIDSNARSEWQECLQKAAFVASPTNFDLFETLAFGLKPNPMVTLHLDRLERSARELGFSFDRRALEVKLGRLKSRLKSTVRLKITLERSGRFRFEFARLPTPIETEVAVAIVKRSNPSDDFRLGYKTTDRRSYDEARAAAGTFEVLFVDDRGFLTEGSFTNLFVQSYDVLLTPPLRRGLLPGVLRRHLINQGAAVEEDLRPADLKAGFWVGNSLRGLIPAALR